MTGQPTLDEKREFVRNPFALPKAKRESMTLKPLLIGKRQCPRCLDWSFLPAIGWCYECGYHTEKE